MKRFAPHEFKNQVKWDEAWKPLIIIPVDVYKDIHCIVEAAKTEVTWIGTIKRLDEQKYYLQEVFLTEQVGSSAHSKLTAQGLGKWTREIVTERPDESEWIINNFRFYGHSHPGMSTSPSSQDNEEFNNIVRDTKDYFVRCICNKDGRMEMSVIFFAQKLKITDVAWELHIPIEEERKKKWRQEVKDKVQVRHNYGYHYQRQHHHQAYQPAYETPPRYAARIPGYQESATDLETDKTNAPTKTEERDKKDQETERTEIVKESPKTTTPLEINQDDAEDVEVDVNEVQFHQKQSNEYRGHNHGRKAWWSSPGSGY